MKSADDARRAKAAVDRAVREARHEGYEAARADAERVTYEGEDALFAWLRGHDVHDRMSQS